MRIIFGIFCFCFGVFLRWLAMRKLGRNFRLTLETPDKIETSGIYRYMRHPSYFGSLLMILGLSMIGPVLGIMAISWAFFMARIVNEEQKLTGKAYREYKKRTGIFYPRKRPWE